MNLQHLKYFQVVAKEENYLRASQKLFITQSALSRAIAALEDELNVELFEKCGRNVRITPAGLKFLEHVNQGLEIIDHGVEELNQMMGRMEGTITLSSIYAFTYHHLPSLINQFNVLYPNVRFQIRPSSTADVIMQTHLGESDIGIHCESAIMKRFTDLNFYKIHKEEIVVIVPPSHPLANQTSCHLKDIVSERFVSFDSSSGMLYRTQKMFADSGLKFSPYVTVTDDQSIVNMVKGNMVKGNMAIACVLKNIAQNNTGLTVLSIDDDVDKYLNIYLAIKQRSIYSTTLQTFFDFALQHIPKTD